MHKITISQYNRTPNDYKGVIDTDGTRNDNLKLNGKRTLLTWDKEAGTVLLIEGLSLEIINDEPVKAGE